MVGALAAASCGPWLPAELGPAAPLAAAARQTPFEEARMRMVEEHLRGRDITDERVLTRLRALQQRVWAGRRVVDNHSKDGRI